MKKWPKKNALLNLASLQRGLLLSLVSTLLIACSFAPKYQRPPMPLPLHYKETAEWKRAKGLSATTKNAPWWHMFKDPVLNELQDKLTCANQNLKVAFARYQEARAAAQVARAAFYPTVLGIANADRQQTSKTVANPNPMPLFDDYLIGLDVSYEVDIWGRVRNAVAASESLAQASAADLVGVSLSMHAELALDYFNLRGDEEAQRVLDATVAAYQKNLYLVRKRHDGGLVPVADVDEAITQLENAKTQATDLRLQRAQLEHAIAVLVGEIPANFKLPKAKTGMKLVYVAPELPSSLVERRPDITAAEQRVFAANAEIGVAYAAFFPQILLSGVAGYESRSLAKLLTQPSLFWSLGPINALTAFQPLANVVIFDGGRLRGQLKEAKAGYHETVATYRQIVLNAFQEVENGLVAIRRLDEENRSQRAATAAAKRALVQSIDRYKGGIVNYLDVIINENFALQTELALVNIRTRRQLASVQLIKALGGGWSCRNKCVPV